MSYPLIIEPSEYLGYSEGSLCILPIVLLLLLALLIKKENKVYYERIGF
jgi:hypothetical protein